MPTQFTAFLKTIEPGALLTAIAMSVTAGGWAWSVDNRLSELEEDLVAGGSLLPAEAVLIHDAPCPKGWHQEEKLNGKFVLAVGEGTLKTNNGDMPLTRRLFDEQGGEEKNKLTKLEMPEHNHSMPSDTLVRDNTLKNLGDSEYEISGSKFGINSTDTQWSHLAGENVPHNNMPPYIGLYFCKKDK